MSVNSTIRNRERSSRQRVETQTDNIRAGIDDGSFRLSLLQRILLMTDGTVTDILKLYAGEAISVRRLEQTITRDNTQPLLSVSPETALLKRRVILCGDKTNYLYAESFLVFDMLTETMRYKLLETDCPMGRVWKEERLETYREVVEHRIAPCPRVSMHFDVPLHIPILSRTYLVFVRNKSFGVVTESFPSTYFIKSVSERTLEGKGRIQLKFSD